MQLILFKFSLIVRTLSGWRRGASIVLITLGVLAVVTGCDEPVERLVAEAGALHAAGNFPAAEIKLEAALAQHPKNIPARLLAARIYIDLGQGDAALGLLIRAQQDGAREQDIAKPRAEAALVASHYVDVIKDTDNPPDSLSNSVKASLLAFRGAALGALGREAGARSAFEEGLALDPHSLDVRISLARLAIVNGELDEARHQLADATREAPRDRRLIQIEGDIGYAARDYSAAEQTYRKILELGALE